jgi:hypothetical protein
MTKESKEAASYHCQNIPKNLFLSSQECQTPAQEFFPYQSKFSTFHSKFKQIKSSLKTFPKV